MRTYLNYFLSGLIFIAPVALTLYICYLIFVTVDGWLQLPIPGAGFVLTILIITGVGFLTSNFLARRALEWLEGLLTRLPFVRLVYTAIKDVLGAFVGEKKRFDKPVAVALGPDGSPMALGFVTQESLAQLGLADHVAVYLPQSYNFAGQLLVCPAARVTPLAAPSSDLMAFIVSGGVTDVAEPLPDGAGPAPGGAVPPTARAP